MAVSPTHFRAELETSGMAEVATSSLAEHCPVTIAEMRDRITE
jgi:hypothetical protein